MATASRQSTSHPISYYWNVVKDMDKDFYTPEEAYELVMEDIKDIYNL